MRLAIGRRWRRHATGYAFVGPAVLILGAFLVYPVLYSAWLSLHEWDGYTPRWGPFVGVENYRALATDEVFCRDWRPWRNVFIVWPGYRRVPTNPHPVVVGVISDFSGRLPRGTLDW